MNVAEPFSYKDSETVLKPQWVIELLDKTTKGGAIVTTDAVNRYYQSVGIGHLSADGRRETKSHRTQSTGGDPLIRILKQCLNHNGLLNCWIKRPRAEQSLRRT
jgi:hypothetical protein